MVPRARFERAFLEPKSSVMPARPTGNKSVLLRRLAPPQQPPASEAGDLLIDLLLIKTLFYKLAKPERFERSKHFCLLSFQDSALNQTRPRFHYWRTVWDFNP
jgi:hypothetical protein